jgi:WD40 repeat protein
MDYSVRIWDLETNQQVGNPLLHDDEVLTVAASADGTFIASAGKEAKVYVWNMMAALKQSDDEVAVSMPFYSRRRF